MYRDGGMCVVGLVCVVVWDVFASNQKVFGCYIGVVCGQFADVFVLDCRCCVVYAFGGV